MFTSKSKGIHNHIKGLGLDDMGEPIDTEDSIFGQVDARKCLGLVVDMVRSQMYAGKCLLLAGPSGSGKSALAVALSEELGTKIPFVSISASELYSSEVKKTEILEEFLRLSVLVRIKEFKDVYEGEVVNIRDLSIDLRSGKGTKSLRLSKELTDQLVYQNVKVGDVIHIDSSSGILKRMGRGESHLNDYDLEAERYVPLPKGEIQKKREFVHETTLHNLDMSNVNPTNQDVLSLVHQIVRYKKSEVTDKLRKDVNDLINNYDKAEIVPGVLFIDDANLLDMDCFSYLNKSLDSNNSPTIILSSNVKEGRVRGSEEISPFGISEDLLRRLLVIPVQKNENEDDIVKSRLSKEQIEVDEEGLKSILDLCRKRGLQQVISLIKMLKCVDGKVSLKEVQEVSGLFN